MIATATLLVFEGLQDLVAEHAVAVQAAQDAALTATALELGISADVVEDFRGWSCFFCLFLLDGFFRSDFLGHFSARTGYSFLVGPLFGSLFDEVGAMRTVTVLPFVGFGYLQVQLDVEELAGLFVIFRCGVSVWISHVLNGIVLINVRIISLNAFFTMVLVVQFWFHHIFANVTFRMENYILHCQYF